MTVLHAVSFKRLFSRALAAAPGRLHMAAHSHHLWPDATFAGQIRAWEDAARLADSKWDRILGPVLGAAQRRVCAEIGGLDPSTIVFAPNTQEFVLRLLLGEGGRPLRTLSTDGEFHSFRRQARRLAEAGLISLEEAPVAPFETFAQRFLSRASSGDVDLVFVSHVFFGTGWIFDEALELARLAEAGGPLCVIDGYHRFMAAPLDLGPAAKSLFYLGGGYKYAMAGEGAAFLAAPPARLSRPASTGWFAAFSALEAPGAGIGYGADAQRLMGATFDASGLYRLNAVFDMLEQEGLDTAAVSARTFALQDMLISAIAQGRAGALADAELLNPPTSAGRARFLAFRHGRAGKWREALGVDGVATDVRDDVLRVGLGLYHDAEDIERFVEICRRRLA